MKVNVAVVVILFLLSPSSIYALQTPEVSQHSQPTMASNSLDLLEVDSAQGVEVISFTDPNSAGIVSFIVVNGTSDDVSVNQVKADVYDKNDALIGVATSPGGAFISPDLLHPGDVAAGYIYLRDIDLSKLERIEFSVESSPPDRMNSLSPALEFKDVQWTGMALTGIIVNPHEVDVVSVSFTAVCVSSDGEILGYMSDLQSISIPSGGEQTFQLSPRDNTDCENYVLGANSV